MAERVNPSVAKVTENTISPAVVSAPERASFDLPWRTIGSIEQTSSIPATALAMSCHIRRILLHFCPSSHSHRGPLHAFETPLGYHQEFQLHHSCENNFVRW